MTTSGADDAMWPTAKDIEGYLTAPHPSTRSTWALMAGRTLTRQQYRRGLADKDPLVRQAFASICIPLTPAELESGLRDPDARVRYAFLGRLDTKLSFHQFARGIHDPNIDVRLEFIRRIEREWRPSRAQIIEGMRHPDPRIRAEWLSRPDIDIDQKYVQAALQDPDPAVRLASIFRYPCHSHIIREYAFMGTEAERLAFAERFDAASTRLMYARGLADPSPLVRAAWTARMDHALTGDQITGLLGDSSADVRLRVIRRTDWKPSAPQIEEVLLDECDAVRLALAMRRDIELTDAQIARGRADECATVRAAFDLWVQRPWHFGRPSLKPDFVDRAMREPCAKIRWFIATHYEFAATRDQYELGLTDPYPEVRFEWAIRTDMSPGLMEVTRGLRDPCFKVREAWYDNASLLLPWWSLQ